jgi:hypothetical protein
MMRPPRRTTVGKTNGLFLSWNKFRGPGDVSFERAQVKPWEDTRTSTNSPWGALWPGADDGGLYHDQYVTVNLSP